MHDRAYALFSLAFLTLLGLGVAAAIIWLVDPGTQRQPYDLVTEDNVAGLDDSSRLYYRGIMAGRVDSVGIDAEGRIRIRIQVDPEIPVTHGTYATLATRGLTGIAHITLDDDGSDRRPLETTPDDPARIPLRPGLLDQITETGEAVFAELQELARRMNRLLADDNIAHADAILANMESASGEMTEIQREARDFLATLPPLVDDARSTLGRVDRMTTDFAELAPHMAAVSDEFAELARSASHLSTRLDRELLPQVHQTLDRVGRTTEEIGRTAQEIGRTAEDVSRAARELERQPESLLRGRTPGRPGPGEPGHQPRGGN